MSTPREANHGVLFHIGVWWNSEDVLKESPIETGEERLHVFLGEPFERCQNRMVTLLQTWESVIFWSPGICFDWREFVPFSRLGRPFRWTTFSKEEFGSPSSLDRIRDELAATNLVFMVLGDGANEYSEMSKVLAKAASAVPETEPIIYCFPCPPPGQENRLPYLTIIYRG